MPQPPPTDPIAAVAHPDPYPYYAALRSGGSLQRDAALGLWIGVGADVVDLLLREPAARVRPPPSRSLASCSARARAPSSAHWPA
jgi:hypothetical protein